MFFLEEVTLLSHCNPVQRATRNLAPKPWFPLSAGSRCTEDEWGREAQIPWGQEEEEEEQQQQFASRAGEGSGSWEIYQDVSTLPEASEFSAGKQPPPAASGAGPPGGCGRDAGAQGAALWVQLVAGRAGCSARPSAAGWGAAGERGRSR